jgi:hypothetical protein
MWTKDFAEFFEVDLVQIGRAHAFLVPMARQVQIPVSRVPELLYGVFELLSRAHVPIAAVLTMEPKNAGYDCSFEAAVSFIVRIK